MCRVETVGPQSRHGSSGHRAGLSPMMVRIGSMPGVACGCGWSTTRPIIAHLLIDALESNCWGRDLAGHRSCPFSSDAAEARISRESPSSSTARAIDTAPTSVDSAVIAVARLRSLGPGWEQSHQHLDVDADLARVRGSRPRIAARDVGRERRDGAARREAIAVGDAQVRVDDRRQWIVGRIGDRRHRLRRRRGARVPPLRPRVRHATRSVDRSRHASARRRASGRPPRPCRPRPRGSGTPRRRRSVRGARRLFAREWPMRCLSVLVDRVDDGRHPAIWMTGVILS